jgi:hypothetical protein
MGLDVVSAEPPLEPFDINAFADGLARFMVALLGVTFLLVPHYCHEFRKQSELEIGDLKHYSCCIWDFLELPVRGQQRRSAWWRCGICCCDDRVCWECVE